MSSTTLQEIYSKQSGQAAPVSADLVSNEGSHANTGTSTPAGGRTPRRRMILDPSEGPTLKSGASDTLGLGGSNKTPRTPGGGATTGDARQQLESGWKLVREFIHSQGDRTVHFSGEAGEVLGNLPVKRYLVVTENAIYRIPHSTVDTGIFFDCRTQLDSVSQLITQDALAHAESQTPSGNVAETTFMDAQVQCYLNESAEASAKKSFVNDPMNAGAAAVPGSATGVPFFTLSFGLETTRRKAFLLALCAARPTLSILQKRHVRDKAQPYDARKGMSVDQRKGRIRSPNTNEKPLPADKSNNKSASVVHRGDSIPGASPIVRRLALDSKSPSRDPSAAPSWNGGTHCAPRHLPLGGPGGDSSRRVNSGRTNSGRGFSQASSPGRSLVSPSVNGAATSQHIDADVSDTDFEEQKKMLRSLLGGSAAGDTGHYDAEKAMARPPEEDESRRVEREKLKAELDSREAKMMQNILFRVKYPQKVPTKVPPGVEFDKAHEERIQLPDDFTDEDLLGPSLFPLWDTWKRTGGLMGNDGVPTDWTLFDSQDLIDSLNQCEEVLFGVVGKMSLRRVATMRELVDRERQMFLNKKAFHEREAAMEEELQREMNADAFSEGSGGGYDSPSHSRSRRSQTLKSASRTRGVPQAQLQEVTQVQPFRLSHSPTHLRKLKVIDSKQLVADMKSNFERHMRNMHELQKEQLENQLQRASIED